MHSPNYGPDPTSPHTTFVQADPSNFRAIVQKLTGASDDPSAQKLPLTLPSRGGLTPKTTNTTTTTPMPPNPTRPTTTSSRPAFKLHERRQRKLEIQLSNTFHEACHLKSPQLSSPSSGGHQFAAARQYTNFCSNNASNNNNMVMVSPVSPLDLFARASPRTPVSTTTSSSCAEEEEERAIAEKGFYLHPSPRNTPRGSDPPELLPLFPLPSPRDNDHRDK